MTPMTMWQTTSLDESIAEEFFGWKWMAFDDQCHASKRVIVRQLMSPGQMVHPQWLEFFHEPGVNGHDATGDEPKAELSHSVASPPHYSGHWEAIRQLEDELRLRKLWAAYREILWGQIGGDGAIDEERLAASECEPRCIAALAAIGSNRVCAEERP